MSLLLMMLLPDARGVGQMPTEPASSRPAMRPSGSASDTGIESRIRLRPIDRAAVRIITISGLAGYAFDSQATGSRRTVCLPDAGHGTGVVVGPDGLVLTAAHVVQGADVIAVLRPGSDEPQPARALYTDADRDLAVLHVDGGLPNAIRLPPRPRPLELSERLFATGYPLAIQERYPAAVSGELSRENNDGLLQIAMSVNPGNSGGPVIDAQGRLVGIMSKRGEPTRGVSGIALIEPLRFVLPVMTRARAAIADRTPTYLPQERHLARVLADFVRTTDERPIWEQTATATLDEAATHPPSYEAGALIAAHAWNMQIALLEARNVTSRDQLPAEDRELAERLNGIALRLATWAVRGAPYLTINYGGLRGIIVSEGRPWVSQSGELDRSQP